MAHSENIPPRPIWQSYAVVGAAAPKVAAIIGAWSGEPLGGERAVEIIMGALATSDLDGYRLARNLEDGLGIKPDADLVESLDEAFDILSDAEVDAVAAWVAEHGVSCPAGVGDTVRAKWGGETIEGVIVEIDTRLGLCMIPTGGPDERRAVVRFEDVERVRREDQPASSGGEGWWLCEVDGEPELTVGHPVETGQFERAENIRPATAETLKEALFAARGRYADLASKPMYAPGLRDKIALLRSILSDARVYVESCAEDPDSPENLAAGVLRRLDAALSGEGT